MSNTLYLLQRVIPSAESIMSFWSSAFSKIYGVLLLLIQRQSRQYDAFEFLLQLFDILHEDLKLPEQDRSVISDLCQSQIITRRDFRCNHVDNSDKEPYLILSLPSSKSRISLESCIAEWKRAEAFDDASPLWYSNYRHLKAFRCPDMLSFNFFDSSMAFRVQSKIPGQLPIRLDLTPRDYCSQHTQQKNIR
jgi:hypothetical protein